MNNIIQFPTTRITTATRSQVVARAAVERVKQFSAMPAYVTSNAALNRAATALQQKGWAVQPLVCGFIECSHPAIMTARKLDIYEAWQLQRAMEEVQA